MDLTNSLFSSEDFATENIIPELLSNSKGHVFKKSRLVPVALWYKFPDRFIADKIIPNLRKHNYEVARRLGPHTKEVDLSNVEIIFFLNELCSHSEKERLQILADKYKKQILPISRKKSGWEFQFNFVQKSSLTTEVVMPAPHSVPNNKLNDFCNDFIRLKNQGVSYQEMIPSLKKYYAVGELKSRGQLTQYIRHLVSSGRAPKSFVEFLNTSRQEKFAEEQSEEIAANNQTPEAPISGVRLSSVVPSDEKDTSEELKIMESLYKEQLAGLEKQIQELKLQNQALQMSSANVVSVTKVDDGAVKLVRIVSNLLEAQKLGIASPEQILKSIQEQYSKIFSKSASQ